MAGCLWEQEGCVVEGAGSVGVAPGWGHCAAR